MPDLFALSPAESARLANYDPALAEASIAVTPTPEQRAAQARARTAFARISWNPYLHNPRLPARLHRVRVPALVLWGEEDRVIPVAYAAEYERASARWDALKSDLWLPKRHVAALWGHLRASHLRLRPPRLRSCRSRTRRSAPFRG